MGMFLQSPEYTNIEGGGGIIKIFDQVQKYATLEGT